MTAVTVFLAVVVVFLLYAVKQHDRRLRKLENGAAVSINPSLGAAESRDPVTELGAGLLSRQKE